MTHIVKQKEYLPHARCPFKTCNPIPAYARDSFNLVWTIQKSRSHDIAKTGDWGDLRRIPPSVLVMNAPLRVALFYIFAFGKFS
ncbi:MAG: hypothetical protein A2428_11580 [Bdellovibrionales bacterium RIFOXYC1_FULL_54_43]|nr:MAG: hypothetical protein A2428_11580 [Bdellovibrionales bacterium RIFOXYC1_FULL_54_43]OFZ82783.1 MAG: hypothetical protein A2603_04955 [Bdellovibrionales bacterium RIFOXYD1_FULL_55_31]